MAFTNEQIIDFLIKNKKFFLTVRDDPEQLAEYLASDKGKLHETSINNFSQQFYEVIEGKVVLITDLNAILEDDENEARVGQLDSYLKEYPFIKTFLSENLENLAPLIAGWETWYPEKEAEKEVKKQKQEIEKAAKAAEKNYYLNEMSESGMIEATEKRYLKLLKEVRVLVRAEGKKALDFLNPLPIESNQNNDATKRIGEQKTILEQFFQEFANASDGAFEKAAKRFILTKKATNKDFAISVKYDPIMFLLDIHQAEIHRLFESAELVELADICNSYKTSLEEKIRIELRKLPQETQKQYYIFPKNTDLKTIDTNTLPLNLDALIAKVDSGQRLLAFVDWQNSLHTNETHPALTQAIKKYNVVNKLTKILADNKLDSAQKLEQFNKKFFAQDSGAKITMESMRDTASANFTGNIIRVLTLGLLSKEQAKKIVSYFWKPEGKKVAKEIVKCKERYSMKK